MSEEYREYETESGKKYRSYYDPATGEYGPYKAETRIDHEVIFNERVSLKTKSSGDKPSQEGTVSLYAKPNGQLYIVDKDGNELNVSIDVSIGSAIEGDINFGVSPGTMNIALGDLIKDNPDVYSVTAIFTMQDTDGNPIRTFNGTVPVSATPTTAGSGSVLLGGINAIEFVAGVAQADLLVRWDGLWAADDILTLTLGDTTSIHGHSIADQDSVYTINDSVEFSLDPATTGSSAATIASDISEAEKFVRSVEISLVDGSGEVIPYNGTVPISVAEVTAGDGVAAIEEDATEIELVDGIATVNIEYTGTWASGDTCTLTVGNSTELGTDVNVAVADGTSVDTIIA